ncbi:MAG: PA3496 family putative envelope integrity protein [Burkholderiaceae bacterium]
MSNKLKPMTATHARRIKEGGLESKPSDYANPSRIAQAQRNVRKAIEEIEEAKRLKRELDWSNYDL